MDEVEFEDLQEQARQFAKEAAQQVCGDIESEVRGDVITAYRSAFSGLDEDEPDLAATTAPDLVANDEVNRVMEVANRAAQEAAYKVALYFLTKQQSE